jgi:hypothetical protein
MARHPTGHPLLLAHRRGHGLKLGLEKRTRDNQCSRTGGSDSPAAVATALSSGGVTDRLSALALVPVLGNVVNRSLSRSTCRTSLASLIRRGGHSAGITG